MPSKVEGIQVALRSYFDRFPRLSVKGLSARTSVPYATLRRLMQDEVSDIKDETIFKLIDRVMTRQERRAFLREYYPLLCRMMDEEDEVQEELREIQRYRDREPHRYILELLEREANVSRSDVQRLTGEWGSAALDEMLVRGLLVQDHAHIRKAKAPINDSVLQ